MIGHKLMRLTKYRRWNVITTGTDRATARRQIRIYEGSSTLLVHYRPAVVITIGISRVTTTRVYTCYYLYYYCCYRSYGQRRRRVFFFPLPFLSLLLVLSDRSATVVALCRCAFSSLSVCRRSIQTRYFLISFRLPRLHRWATYLSHAHTKWHF